jgi:hypothetical protein
MSSFPDGTGPVCPRCHRVQIKNRGSKICGRCHLDAGWHQRDDAGPEIVAPPPIEPLTSYEDARAQWEREIGQMRERYKGPAKPRPERARQHVAVCADLHIPFHEPEFLAEFITRESKKTDVCVVVGDLSDAYALSRFLLYESMPWSREWAAVQVALEALSEAFPVVRLVVGNHDARLHKQLLSRLTPDMMEAVKFLTGGVLCPLTMLSRRFTNVEIARHETRDGQTIDWFTTIGDVWLGHPEVWSIVPTGSTRKVEQTLGTKWREWELEQYRLIAVAHTHQYSDILWRGARLIETGCLAKTQGYQNTPKLSPTTQRRLYWAFDQVDGHTDLNSLYHWDFDEAREQAQQRKVA